MKTLIAILALIIGTTISMNAQTQAKPAAQPATQSTAQPAVHATSQPSNHQTTQPAQQTAQAQSQSKSVLKISELMKPIQENLATQFKGWTPVQAYKMDTKGVVSYEVMVRKEQNEMKLFYDKDGKFLREEPVAAMKPETKKEVAPVKPSSKPK